MQIVVLAAGQGKRYKDGGYEPPKPLIKYRGKPMIEIVLDQFTQSGYEPIVIGSPEVCAWLREKAKDGYYVRHVNVPYLQRGPAASAALASAHLDPEAPTAIFDSDGFFTQSALKSFLFDGIKDSDSEINMLCTNYDGDTKAFCNVEMASKEDPSRVTYVYEKMSVSKTIAVGGYMFRHWYTFLDYYAAHRYYEEVKELYISGVIKEAIDHNVKVSATIIPYEDWVCLGTPADLERRQNAV